MTLPCIPATDKKQPVQYEYIHPLISLCYVFINPGPGDEQHETTSDRNKQYVRYSARSADDFLITKTRGLRNDARSANAARMAQRPSKLPHDDLLITQTRRRQLKQWRKTKQGRRRKGRFQSRLRLNASQFKAQVWRYLVRCFLLVVALFP